MYYDGDTSISCSTKHCNENRFDDDGNPKASVEQLAYLINSSKFRNSINYKENRKTVYFSRKNLIPTGTKLYEDFYDRSAQQQSEQEIESDYHLQLAMYTDGFNSFKRGGLSLTIVMFVVMNLPSEER